MFHLTFLQPFQADKEMEDRRFQFSGKTTGTTRHRGLSQRDVFSCATAKRLTGGSRRGAAQSLFKSALRHHPGGSQKVNLPRSRRTRSRLVAEIDGTPATSYKSFSVMGKSFDPAKPDEYLASFKIRKAF
jgi:hypothetical protein